MNIVTMILLRSWLIQQLKQVIFFTWDINFMVIKYAQEIILMILNGLNIGHMYIRQQLFDNYIGDGCSSGSDSDSGCVSEDYLHSESKWKCNNNCPIMFVYGFQGNLAKLPNDSAMDHCFSDYKNSEVNKHNRKIIQSTTISGFVSNYHKAIEVFHEIKGDDCYFGRTNKSHKHIIDKKYSMNARGKCGKYEKWDDDHPIHFIGHSQGSTAINELLLLLHNKDIPYYHKGCSDKKLKKMLERRKIIFKPDTQCYYYNTSSKMVHSWISLSSPNGGLGKFNEIICKFQCTPKPNYKKLFDIKSYESIYIWLSMMTAYYFIEISYNCCSYLNFNYNGLAQTVLPMNAHKLIKKRTLQKLNIFKPSTWLTYKHLTPQYKIQNHIGDFVVSSLNAPSKKRCSDLDALSKVSTHISRMPCICVCTSNVIDYSDKISYILSPFKLEQLSDFLYVWSKFMHDYVNTKLCLNEQYSNDGVVSLDNQRSYDVITSNICTTFTEIHDLDTYDKYMKPINIHIHNVDHLGLKLPNSLKCAYKKRYIAKKIMKFIDSIPSDYEDPKYMNHKTTEIPHFQE